MLSKQQYCSTHFPNGYSHWSKLMFICSNSDLLSGKKSLKTTNESNGQKKKDKKINNDLQNTI
jgi:hypothetical protein